MYKFYAARVYPKGQKNSQGRVNPHFHTKGDEPYQILKGKGRMHIGKVSEGNIIVWKSPNSKKSGDTIIVKAGAVHSFEMEGEDYVDFVFACPHSHLGENENGEKSEEANDRFFTDPNNKDTKEKYTNPFPEYKKD